MHAWKTVFAILVLFFVCTIADAQKREILKDSTPEERAKFQTEWMKTALNLDEKQMAAVYEINLKHARKNQELLASNERKRRKVRKAKSLAKEKGKELQNVLTKEQYAKYQKNKDELKQIIKERRQ